MPSIIPGYIYAFVASIIVGTLIIAACGLATANIKANAEKQQLSNIAQYVATKSAEIMSSAPIENSTLRISLSIPPLIGNQRYWIQIFNDSSQACVEAGFGTNIASSGQRAYIPSEVFASGACMSDFNPPSIVYQQNSTGSYLFIEGDK